MDAVQPYAVSYSVRVRDETRALVRRARGSGLGELVFAAIREIDTRLRIYPQFGQPQRNLSVHPAQLWIGVVAPLVVRYVLDESRRQVIVAHPFVTIPGCGF